MSSEGNPLPLTTSVEITDEQPRTVDMLADEGERILDVLGSDTARTILTALREEPATISDIAERVGTTLQNAHYHIERFHDAGLVRVVSTQYSSRGSEMNVYAVDGAPLMLVCMNNEQISPVTTSVDRKKADPR